MPAPTPAPAAGPRLTVSIDDVRDPERLLAVLQRLHRQDYDLLDLIDSAAQRAAATPSTTSSLADLPSRVVSLEQLLTSLSVGGASSAITSQQAAIPKLDALPPVATASEGDAVWFNGTLYRFDSIVNDFVPIVSAAAAHNLLSATHGDTVAAAVVQGDLAVGDATPKWARFALGAALQHLHVNAGGGAPEWTTLRWGCYTYPTAAQSIADSTWTAVQLTSELYDYTACHNNVTNNSRLTVPAGGDGTYAAFGQVAFAAAATGIRGGRISGNGSFVVGRSAIELAPTAGDVLYLPVFMAPRALVATDYLELEAFQSRGSALNTNAGDSAATYFAFWRVGD